MTFVKGSPCVLWRAGGQAQEREPENCLMLSVFNHFLEGRYGKFKPSPEMGYSKNRMHIITK